MLDLKEGQFELIESSVAEENPGLLMGRGTCVNVRNFTPATPDVRNADASLPMADGTASGRDYRDGRVYALDMNALSRTPANPRLPDGVDESDDPGQEALDVADLIETVWAADRTRFTPGAVQVLRWRAGGRIRRIYGRTRDVSPDPKNFQSGNIPFTTNFRANDDLVYSDDLKAQTVGIVPATSGGALAPFRFPLRFTKPTSGSVGTLQVRGSRATWPVATIYGPHNGSLAQPIIEIAGFGRIRLNTTIAYDQSVTIDTRPWTRGVRRSDGASLAGAIDTASTPPTLFRLPPGAWNVVLKGIDPSGTSQLTVQWRDAYSSI